jgi:hypothetical protein
MVYYGNHGKRAGKRKVRKSGSICLKLVDGSVCHNLPTESAKVSQYYVICGTEDMNSGASETERPRCLWIQMIPLRYGIVAVNNDGMTFKQNDCALNNCWYVPKVSVNGVSTILVCSFW